jgi:hypothetical protein
MWVFRGHRLEHPPEAEASPWRSNSHTPTGKSPTTTTAPSGSRRGVLKLGRENGEWSVFVSPGHWATIEVGKDTKKKDDKEDKDEKSDKVEKRDKEDKDDKDDKDDD